MTRLLDPDVIAARKAAMRARNDAIAAVRREEVAWFAEWTTESAEGLAVRLGTNVESLEQWCRRHGMWGEFCRLRARNPLDVAS